MSRGLRVAFWVLIGGALAALLTGCGGGGNSAYSTSALSARTDGKVAIAAQTFAMVNAAGETTTRTMSIPAAVGTPGQEISVPVTVSDTSAIAGVLVKLDLDKTTFTCVGITSGEWITPQAYVAKNVAGAALAVASTPGASGAGVAPAQASKPAIIATFRLRILPTAAPQNASLKLTAVLADVKGQTLGRTKPEGTAVIRPQASNLIGDLLGTGQADVGSAIKILRVVVSLDSKPADADLWQWDCDKSGVIDVGDAIKLLRCVVGLDTWPIGTGGSADGTYDVIDLGTFAQASYSYAYGINATGQVVGFSNTPADGPLHAFLYTGGVMKDLGTLGGSGSIAYGVNATGQVAGSSHIAKDAEQHAFLYSGGVMNDLGTLGGQKSEANAINNAGQLVGYAYVADRITWHAFLYSGGIMHDLGTLGGSTSTANGINSGGQVVGYSDMPPYDLQTHAFLYSGLTMRDLGTLGGSDSQATAINTAGQVVGGSNTTAGPWHAFLYTGGTMRDLGTLGGDNSHAYSINTAGLIVGESTTKTGGTHAFVYKNGVLGDLNSLLDLSKVQNQNWVLERAAAINDSGWIAGYGSHNGGQRHAFLAKPHNVVTAQVAAKTSQ